MAGVFVGEEGLGGIETPVDGEGGVDDRDAAVGLGMVVVVTLILEHGDVGEHREAVCETSGDEELPVIVLRQLHCHMLAIGWRALADVDRHIEHRALHAAHQLRLRERH